MESPNYHIYGLINPQDYSLYIDYVVQDVESHRQELLETLQRKSVNEPAFQQWLKDLHPYDVFELECLERHEAIQEAVDFWRTYFRACGETIINARHFMDHLK